VSDITAAVISAAVKAVVRNSFIKPSYKHCPPNSSALNVEQFTGNIVPARSGQLFSRMSWGQRSAAK
jgi:hypothetical protein